MDELAKVCRDYYKEVWLEALNLAGVPATSEWGEVGNICYPSDFRDVPVELPPSTALTPLLIEPPFITQASLPPPEVPKGPSQVGDQG